MSKKKKPSRRRTGGATRRRQRRPPSLQKILRAIEQTEADIRRYAARRVDVGADVLRFLSGLRELVHVMCLGAGKDLQAVPRSLGDD